MHTKLAFVIPTFVGILLASVLACNNAEPDPMLARAQVELDRHRSLWEQTRPNTYTYEYNAVCECSDNLGGTVKVTITNGDVESAAYADPRATPWLSGVNRYLTIDSLFDVIQDAITGEAGQPIVWHTNAITGKADQLIVSYNSEFGYPANIAIDYNVNAIDDEYYLTATAYSPR